MVWPLFLISRQEKNSANVTITMNYYLRKVFVVFAIFSLKARNCRISKNENVKM